MDPQRRIELLMKTAQGRAVLEAETAEFARAKTPKEYTETTKRGARYRLTAAGNKQYEPKAEKAAREAKEKAGGGAAPTQSGEDHYGAARAEAAGKTNGEIRRDMQEARSDQEHHQQQAAGTSSPLQQRMHHNLAQQAGQVAQAHGDELDDREKNRAKAEGPTSVPSKPVSPPHDSAKGGDDRLWSRGSLGSTSIDKGGLSPRAIASGKQVYAESARQASGASDERLAAIAKSHLTASAEHLDNAHKHKDADHLEQAHHAHQIARAAMDEIARRQGAEKGGTVPPPHDPAPAEAARLKGMSPEQLKSEIQHHARGAHASVQAAGEANGSRKVQSHVDAAAGHMKRVKAAQDELHSRQPGASDAVKRGDAAHAEAVSKARGMSDDDNAHRGIRAHLDANTHRDMADRASTKADKEHHLAEAHIHDRVAEAHKQEHEMRQHQAGVREQAKVSSTKGLAGMRQQLNKEAATHRAAANSTDDPHKRTIHNGLAEAHERASDAIGHALRDREKAAVPSQDHHATARRLAAAAKDHELQDAVRGAKSVIDRHAEKVQGNTDTHADAEDVARAHATQQAAQKEIGNRQAADREIVNRPSHISAGDHHRATERARTFSEGQLAKAAEHHAAKAQASLAGTDKEKAIRDFEKHSHLSMIARRELQHRK